MVYKIRVLGDTYGEYDGDVLIESDKLVKALNCDLLIEYHGEFDFQAIIEPYIRDYAPIKIAYKTAKTQKPVMLSYDGKEFERDVFVTRIAKAVEKLHNRTIKATNLKKLTEKSEKAGWHCVSDTEDLNWGITGDDFFINDIRNSVSVFFVNDQGGYIVFSTCGLRTKKLLTGKQLKAII